MKRRAAKPVAPLAPREPPPAVVAPTGVFVRLPLPPDLAAALSEHFENGMRLRDLLSRADASVIELGRAALEAATAIERDVSRVRAGLKRRKR